jgi:regulator of ribosome biosynthesis
LFCPFQPLPPPNVETKWEKFAKAKGIGMNKTKRSRKVWDESTGEWKFRHGYDKANATDGSTWPIMEVKPGDDPYLDPWEKQRDAKKARVDKNVEQRMRNVERSGGLAKGSTTRTLKHIAKARESGRSGGEMDRNVPAGVPVDLKPVGKKGNGALNVTGASAVTSTKVLRGKESTLSALRASQRSTASLGNFDKMREGEPERKAPKLKKKLSSKPVESKSELETSMKVLKSMASGGGVEREKLKKKGTLAHGETAYDYDYTDGLGASTFRKKKGRAGAGKAKKLTKKRVK